jgi:hypothetical protein
MTCVVPVTWTRVVLALAGFDSASETTASKPAATVRITRPRPVVCAETEVVIIVSSNSWCPRIRSWVLTQRR